MDVPIRRGVKAKAGHEALDRRILRDGTSEMRHTGGMKRQTNTPDRQRLGFMPRAGTNGVLAQPR